MKIYIFLFFFIFAFGRVFSQTIIINAAAVNRPLIWSDFAGNPDMSSTHSANTFWNMNYSYKGITFNGDTAKIIGLLVKLEFNKTKSWVKNGMETSTLLKHEQGHFDIGLICLKELLNQYNNTVFLRADFQKKVTSLFSSVMEKYHQMGITYDAETDHSKNIENQNKWNDFFAKALQPQSLSNI